MREEREGGGGGVGGGGGGSGGGARGKRGRFHFHHIDALVAQGFPECLTSGGHLSERCFVPSYKCLLGAMAT